MKKINVFLVQALLNFVRNVIMNNKFAQCNNLLYIE